MSNKTVSRWESDGGYPDVTMLVPLARALGVTVDDLLDGERPIRTLTKTDWQSLLSFAFALGGGVLYFLLDLFMPGALCYLAYLGCMAYGVYLQKYYTYHSRWFFLANAVMDLSVNLSIAQTLVSSLAKLTVTVTMANQNDLKVRVLWWLVTHRALVTALAVLLAVLLTALTQYLVLKWSRSGALSAFRKPQMPRLRLEAARPTARKLLPLLIPAVVTLFWYGTGREGLPSSVYLGQMKWFRMLAALCVLFCLVLFWKKGRRWMLLPSLGLTALCARYHLLLPGTQKVLALRNGRIFDYDPGFSSALYVRFTQWRWELGIAAGLAALAYLVCCCFRLRRRPEE